MTTLITSAFDPDWCSDVQIRLQEIGVSAPVASTRTEIGPIEWTEKVIKSGGIDVSSTDNLLHAQPGRAWDILAADIFVANADAHTWGWADDRNLPFLQYWRDFDPKSRFLILYAGPHACLAKSLMSEQISTAEVDGFLDRWFSYFGLALDFHQHNRDRSVLLPVEILYEQDDRITDVLNQRFQMNLSKAKQRTNYRHHLCLEIAAERVLSLDSRIRGLMDEMEAASDAPAPPILSDMIALETCYQDTRRIENAQAQIERLTNELEAANSELEGLRSKSHDNETIPLSAQSADHLEQENKLLLRQLHQVQSELERYFRNYQELKDGSEELIVDQSDRDNEATKKESSIEVSRREGAKIDLRSYLNGTGWHAAEQFGRWAGLELNSTVKIPGLMRNDYLLSLEIVDAMDLDIVENLEISFDGMPLRSKKKILSSMGGRLAPIRRLKAKLERVEKPYPILVSAIIPSEIVSVDNFSHEITIHSPSAISPAQSGAKDARTLSFCAAAIEVSKV